MGMPPNPFLKNPVENISKEDIIPLKCKECGNKIFDRYFNIFKLPAEKSATGKTQYIHKPVYVCANCTEILDSGDE